MDTNLIDTVPKVTGYKDVYCVWVNEDLCEGRLRDYVKHYCETEATAFRLAEGADVGGRDGRVTCELAYSICHVVSGEYRWYYPGQAVIPPSEKDKETQRNLDRTRWAAEEKRRLINMMIEKGFTQEDIALLSTP